MVGAGVSDGVGGDDGEAAGMLYKQTEQRETEVGQSDKAVFSAVDGDRDVED